MGALRTIARFARREDGSQSVEAAIIFPLLIWGFIACWTYYDTFKTHGMNSRAAYTVGDMLSRAEQVDAELLEGMNRAFDILVRSSEKSTLRVSVVTLDIDDDGDTYLRLKWSKGTRGNEAYKDVSEIRERVPALALGDTLIVVETFTTYDPPFSAGILAHTVYNISFTRPRFAPQLPWSDGGAASS